MQRTLQEQLLQAAFGRLYRKPEVVPSGEARAKAILTPEARALLAVDDLHVRSYSMRSELARLDQMVRVAGHSPRGW